MSDEIEQVQPPEGSIVSDATTRSEDVFSVQSDNVAATKQYAINATGNLFIATTLNGGEPGNAAISQEAQKAFEQVSVFFAAMTKAMREEGLSLYDTEGIDKIVSDSGLFVKVTESEVFFKSRAWGVHFGNELIQALLGLSGNLASIGKSLMDMVIGIGKEAKNGIDVSGNTSGKKSSVSTIIFVCEYLLGAVSITPIVLSVDSKQTAAVYDIGPCFNMKNKGFSINILKQVYLFVPPSFVSNAKSLNDAMANPDFAALVNTIRDSLNLAEPVSDSGKGSTSGQSAGTASSQ